MYLHKNPKKQNGINYNYYSLAESYRDPKTKKTKTRTFRYLGNLTNKEIENWKLRLKLYNGDLSNVINIDEIKFIDDKNYLDVALFSFLYDLLGFDELFPASKRKKLNPDEVAKILIISRCLSPMANYKTSEWINKTYLPKIMSIDADLYNKDKIFDELANISSARVEIQKHLIGLSKKFNKDEFELYFFDGTTSFFEGECCLLGEPNKDKTNGYQEKVILILLVVDKRGYPVCWEVFCGRASEKIKIQELLTRFKKDFKIKEVTFCFDRGFSTKDNFSIISEQSGLRSKYISALNRNQFEKVFDVDAFTETTRSKLIEDYYFPEKKTKY